MMYQVHTHKTTTTTKKNPTRLDIERKEVSFEILKPLFQSRFFDFLVMAIRKFLHLCRCPFHHNKMRKNMCVCVFLHTYTHTRIIYTVFSGSQYDIITVTTNAPIKLNMQYHHILV